METAGVITVSQEHGMMRANVSRDLARFQDRRLKDETTDIFSRYYDRTNKHISLVIKYGEILSKSINSISPDCKNKFLFNIFKHDESKFENEELIPYAYLTEFYRCKNNGIPFEYPHGMKQLVDRAVIHHYSTNPHHPQYHKNLSSMNVVNIAEMLCDICAMSEEFKDSFTGYIRENVLFKFKWNKQQICYIRSITSLLDLNR